MDINFQVETSYTTQHQEAILKYMGNKYCARHRSVTVNTQESLPRSNLVPSGTVLRSCQSFSYPYDLCSDDKGFLPSDTMAQCTPGRSDRVSRLFTAASLYLRSPPEASHNWVQINPNLNDYHFDPTQISSTFQSPDITNWWWQLEELPSKYPDLSIVACDIFSITPPGVGVP